MADRIEEAKRKNRERMADKRHSEPSYVSLDATEKQLTRLQWYLRTFAENNTAPVPIAMMLESGIWTVDVQVRLPGVTEYDITANHTSLARAIAHAASYLKRQDIILAQARQNQLDYGLTY